jgi:hypothetical protein
MGATSVTGVGQGSAEASCKGAPGRQTLGVGHLIGPHVVSAGTTTLAGGTKALEIAPLTGVAADYIVLATDYTAAAAVKAVLTVSSDIWTITFTGTSSDVIQYAVVSVGN